MKFRCFFYKALSKYSIVILEKLRITAVQELQALKLKKNGFSARSLLLIILFQFYLA